MRCGAWAPSHPQAATSPPISSSSATARAASRVTLPLFPLVNWLRLNDTHLVLIVLYATFFVSLGTLLASADPAKGASGAKACAACHDFAKGGPNKTGPGLWDVVDRAIAAHEGFPYSDGMKARSAEKWTYEALDAFLKDPKTATPKTKMVFAGVKKDQSRADIIAYLASLSDAPKPFPAP